MATIKANGGAASVWERTGHHSGGMPYTFRVVLCRNGKVLTGIGAGAYHHAQAPRLAALVGQPVETQETTLRHLGYARGKRRQRQGLNYRRGLLAPACQTCA